MKWELIGTGLALLGLGVTLSLALPPPFWPKMPTGMFHVLLCIGAVLATSGIAFLIIGIWPYLVELRGAVTLATIGLSFLIIAAYVALWSEKSSPIYPQVLVGWSFGEGGPYRMSIVNPGTDPLINATMTVRNAGAFFNDAASFRLGDLETGLTNPIELPRIPVGYYQINLRYRGGGITQMLLLNFHANTLQQFSWFSDGHGLSVQPSGHIPPLPIYRQMFEQPNPVLSLAYIDSLDFVAPHGKDGFHLDVVSISCKNLTMGPISTRLVNLKVTVDGEKVFEAPSSNEIDGDIKSGLSQLYQFSVNRILKDNIKTIALEGDVETKQGTATYVAHQMTEYELDRVEDYLTFRH